MAISSVFYAVSFIMHSQRFLQMTTKTQHDLLHYSNKKEEPKSDHPTHFYSPI